MQEFTLDAILDNIEKATSFLDSFLEETDCPIKAQMQLDIAMDELFSNVARYAYTPNIGQVTVRMEQTAPRSGVKVTFIDTGIPYNPLEKKDPDVSLPMEERSVGGLGIFMVKKTMNEMFYSRIDNQNILSIVRYFD